MYLGTLDLAAASAIAVVMVVVVVVVVVLLLLLPAAHGRHFYGCLSSGR